jgi:hypothetical protein
VNRNQCYLSAVIESFVDYVSFSDFHFLTGL